MNLKRYVSKKIFFFIFSLSIFFYLTENCGAPQEPVDFAAGEHQCDYCRMGIADLRFRGEAITKKGKIYRFDAIECMSSWSHEHHSEVDSVWVADFINQNQWLRAEDAIYLQSQNLKSPMGAGLSAYPSEEELKKAVEMYGGIRMNKIEMDAYVQKRKE
ncbi:MAG: nitrous oxide reductase accessory protein NosL [Spirochaetia bacterium]|nr:nitrous oxide reductase accessory protein NosL [Spirochaetia bacterium]